MTINWIKCSKRMTPDNMTKVIGRWNENNKPELLLGAYVNLKIEPESAHEYEWMPYEKKTWKELNK